MTAVILNLFTAASPFYTLKYVLPKFQPWLRSKYCTSWLQNIFTEPQNNLHRGCNLCVEIRQQTRSDHILLPCYVLFYEISVMRFRDMSSLLLFLWRHFLKQKYWRHLVRRSVGVYPCWWQITTDPEEAQSTSKNGHRNDVVYTIIIQKNHC